jgi:hypothetical protein
MLRPAGTLATGITTAGIMSVVCLLFFLLPSATAQARLRAGETVQTHATPDPVCVTREDAKKYTNASFECERGSDADCATAKKLQIRKVCGFHFKTYTVLLVEAETSLIKLSRAGHESESYWGDAGDFHVVFKAGQRVSPETNPDPVCVKKSDAKGYASARRTCVSELNQADCASVKKLEAQKACGFGYKTYTVVSVEEAGGLMELAPTGHDVERYWGETDDFFLVP